MTQDEEEEEVRRHLEEKKKKKKPNTPSLPVLFAAVCAMISMSIVRRAASRNCNAGQFSGPSRGGGWQVSKWKQTNGLSPALLSKWIRCRHSLDMLIASPNLSRLCRPSAFVVLIRLLGSFFSVCSPTSVICFRTVQYCIFFVNADVCGGVEPVPQELHPSILRLAFLLPLFTVESAAANRHLPVDAPVFRLRRHDDHSAQLHLPGHDGACRTSRVSTHKIINNYYIPPSLKSRRNQQIS